MNCKDCGLPIEWTDDKGKLRGDHAEEDHPGQCCDCFDEGWFGDLAGFKRDRPRPGSEGAS